MGWRTPLKFADDAVQARKEMEQAFLRGDLNADDLGVLLRSRDLQLKIAEHEALKTELRGLKRNSTNCWPDREERNDQA